MENYQSIQRWADRLQGGGGGNPEILWSVPGIVFVQRSARFTTPVDCTLDAVVVCFETAPTDTAHELKVYKDGASVWDDTCPSSDTLHSFSGIPAEASTADTTLWQVRCTAVGAGSPAYMSVALRFVV